VLDVLASVTKAVCPYLVHFIGASDGSLGFPLLVKLCPTFPELILISNFARAHVTRTDPMHLLKGHLHPQSEFWMIDDNIYFGTKLFYLVFQAFSLNIVRSSNSKHLAMV
jgi:hypothetical protein